MIVALRSETGRTREYVVSSIEEAVKICRKQPYMGIFLYPSHDGEVVDEETFGTLLEAALNEDGYYD